MPPELVIFDLDGTLVDVRDSYREAVRRTVQAYFGQVLGLRGNTALVSHRDIQAFKLAGGLNNDWDLSAALIRYLLSLLDTVPQVSHNVSSIHEAARTLRRAGSQLTLTLAELDKRSDFEAMARELNQAGGGLAGLASLLGSLEHPLLFYSGDLTNHNVVQRLFQEFYLGRRYFSSLHRTPPYFYRGPGLIEQETLLVSRALLQALDQATDHKLGVATGRPEAEARLALDIFQIGGYFRSVVAHEDVVAEESRMARLGEPTTLSKPHPYVVLEAAERLDPGGQRPAVYIGDTPDDMTAARLANRQRPFTGWGALWATSDPEVVRVALQEAGAERILDHPEELGPLFGLPRVTR
jgi:HAD superfamily hydrolase (TIGR01548 family)